MSPLTCLSGTEGTEHPAEGSLGCAAGLELRLLPSSPKPREGTPQEKQPPALLWGWVVGIELVRDPPKPFTGEKRGDRAWMCVEVAGPAYTSPVLSRVPSTRSRPAGAGELWK